MYSKMAWASSRLVCWCRRSSSSSWRVPKKDRPWLRRPHISRKRFMRRLLWVAVVGHDALVDLSGDELFQAEDDAPFGKSFGGAPGDVGTKIFRDTPACAALVMLFASFTGERFGSAGRESGRDCDGRLTLAPIRSLPTRPVGHYGQSPGGADRSTPRHQGQS